MASTLISPKGSSGKSGSNHPTTGGNPNDTPITEEELLNKDTPITIDDVLRLRKPTNSNALTDIRQVWESECASRVLGYLTETDENAYKIDFVHFRIRDMKTNAVLFEVERAHGTMLCS